MKIKTLNAFSVVINRTFGAMLNRLASKPVGPRVRSPMTFGAMLNRLASKPRLSLFNMIGVDQSRFLGVKQIRFAIAFLANVP